MTKAVEIKDLNFGYGETLNLKDVSFSIKKGDFVSIIGPNGSGKSTLLKNIASILRPKDGLIKIDNKDIENYNSKDLAKKMALVPQNTNIAYDFSVFDVVLMGRSPYLSRFQRERDIDYKKTKEALRLTDTLHLSERNINYISGGERQRVIVARALAQDTDILLLDEPTSHLDINHQIEILSLLKKLNKEKDMTIILVLHDLNLASRFSDKIVLVNEGTILAKGIPEEVITYKNLEKVYNLDMVISTNVYTASPYIIPLESKRIYEKKRKKVHVISGGGSGVEVVSKLDKKGFKVSMGVINRGDSDWDIGKKLSLNMIEEMPFNGITEESFKENIKEINNSDIVILTSVPYGNGNIKNLEAAYEALKINKEVYLIDKYNEYEKFDFVKGNATKILKEMKKNGLRVYNDIDKLINDLN
ncbi:MAG: ABC transporter ATP-binding protein [Firmicutes bacterium]|nr:ABC transporter ATP-binding protein [Bacillota bacterium]